MYLLGRLIFYVMDKLYDFFLAHKVALFSSSNAVLATIDRLEASKKPTDG